MAELLNQIFQPEIFDGQTSVATASVSNYATAILRNYGQINKESFQV